MVSPPRQLAHFASFYILTILFGISEKVHHPNLSPASASSLHYLCSAFPHFMFKIHWTFKKCVGNVLNLLLLLSFWNRKLLDNLFGFCRSQHLLNRRVIKSCEMNILLLWKSSWLHIWSCFLHVKVKCKPWSLSTCSAWKFSK